MNNKLLVGVLSMSTFSRNHSAPTRKIINGGCLKKMFVMKFIKKKKKSLSIIWANT